MFDPSKFESLPPVIINRQDFYLQGQEFPHASHEGCATFGFRVQSDPELAKRPGTLL